MVRVRVSLLLCLFVVLFSCTSEQPMPQEEERVEGLGELYIPGEVNVKLSEDLVSTLVLSSNGQMIETKSSVLGNFLEHIEVESVERIFSDDSRYLERQRKAGLHLWYRIKFNPKSQVFTKSGVDAFADIDGIEHVERVARLRSLQSDDPGSQKQWYIGQANGVDINVQPVWAIYTTGTSNVIVSVVDSGIDGEHEDLKGIVLPGMAGKSRNFCKNSNTITAGEHGTHVAGVISAIRNNSKGISGIAGGDASKGVSGVTLMSCQIFDVDDQGKSISGGNEEAIRYAADNGAVISQNSWGYNFDNNNDGVLDAKELDELKNFKMPGALATAIDYFIQYAGCDNKGNQLPDSPMKGGVVIFAAGNDGCAYGWPAMYDKVIAVGAVKPDGYRASFSNYGEWVDICAPGSSIYSTVPGGYRYLDGTSMACPMVSGVAALVLSARGGYGFTNDDLKRCILEGASYDNIPDHQRIGPLVNALNAVAYGVESAPNPIEELTTDILSNSITVKWKIPSRKDGKPAYGGNVYLASDRALLEKLDPRNPSSGIKVLSVETYNAAVDSIASCTFSKLAFESTYYLRAVSFNAGPSFAEASTIVEVKTGVNNPPKISSNVSLEDINLKASDRCEIILSIDDPDGHAISYTYESDNLTGEFVVREANKCKISIDGAKSQTGDYKVKVSAKDSYGMTSELSYSYKVLPNMPPVITKKIDNMLLYLNEGVKELSLSEYFSDPEGENIVYSASYTGKDAVVSTGGATLYITPRNVTSGEIVVTAYDPRKASASQTFRFAVRELGNTIVVSPTKVTDILSIYTGEESLDTEVAIISAQSGAIVCDVKSKSDAFNPLQIDLSKCNPGRYYVKVRYADESAVKTIIKY